MKRLLQINSVANLGSTGRIAEQLGKKVMEEGWESYIAYGRSANQSDSILIRIGNKVDLVSHGLQSRLWDKQGLASKRATKNFIKEIEKIKPDLVHIHNLHGYYLNFPILLSYLDECSIPTVLTVHDCWWFTGHCACIDENCNNWMNVCMDCPLPKSYPKTLISKANRNWNIKNSIFNTVKNITLIPVSDWIDSKLKQSLLKNVPSKVIHNGVDTSVFFREKDVDTSVPHNTFNILCVATKWTEHNGFYKILQLSKLIEEDVRIVIVGVDDRQLKSLPSNVIGVKRTENLAQLRGIYSQADVLLNLTKNLSFGLVTAESMACGTPAIVYSDTAGEEIIDYKTGFVMNQIEEVIPIVSKLKKNYNRENVASECSRRIRENFSLDRQLNAYFDLYTELTERQ